MSSLKSASAFVQGRSHEKNDIPCQDRTYELVTKGFGAIALADGAGSCEASHIGAHHITKTVVHYIKKRFAYLTKLKYPHKHLQKQIENDLKWLAQTKKKEFKELSSTLLFVVIKNGRFIAGHIGGVFKILCQPDIIKI